MLAVAALGLTQTLAWASSYYLPAILASDIAKGTGTTPSMVFAAFSAALLLAAVLGPTVGWIIDQRGGSMVLAVSNLLLAAGLALLGRATGPPGLFLAWAILGLGMAAGLYDAAFAALTAIYGEEARGPITGVSLIAGFASTIGWPISALLDHSIGWQGTCFFWAALHLAIGLPLNLRLLPKPRPLLRATPQALLASWQPRREMLLLSYVFAAAWFVTGAMAAHLPALLEKLGTGPVEAVAASALVGPAQVAARLVEFFILRRAHPLLSARIAACLHPLGALIVGVCGAPCAAMFTVFHGAGNGLLTISRGTVPLALFGPEGYGARTGLIGAPSRVAQACAPLVFGILLNAMGWQVIWVSSGLCLSAFATLLLLAPSKPAPHP